jgi:serine protease AprX
MSRLRVASILGTLLGFFALTAPAHAFDCKTPREWHGKLKSTPLDADGNFLDDAIDNLPPGEVVDVVVDLNRCPSESDRTVLASYGGVIHVSRWLSLAIVHDVRSELLAGLAKEPFVAFVEHNRKLYYMLDVSNPAMKVRSSTTYSPNTVQDAYPNIDGSGVSIAIIDTGVDDGVHQSLPAARFVGGADCSGNSCIEGNPDDTHGHGTHVAGIALGSGNPTNGQNRGIAPGAGLVDLSIYGSANWVQSAIFALEKVIERRSAWSIKVVNMSLGDCANSNGTSALSQMVNRVVDEGVTVVSAQGNAVNCSLPADSALVMSPASADDGIAVARASDNNTVARGNDTLSSDSLEGPRLSDLDGNPFDENKPDLASYGSGITSAQNDTPNGYVSGSGTSMSAPHLAGCAALLYELNPSIKPQSLKKLLLDTAEDFGPAGWDQDWGAGLADCFEAVDDLNTLLKTDLAYDGACGGGGSQPPCWLNPALYPQNPSISEGTQNTIVFEIKNDGPNLSTAFQVKLGVFNFSNSDLAYDICTQTLGPLNSGQSTTVTCPWTPSISGSTGVVHACLKAEIVYPQDSNFANNYAQHNIDIAQTKSPAVFTMEFVNKLSLPLEMELQPTFACQGGVCPGWQLTLDQTEFTMQPDDCPRPVVVRLEPVGPNAVREARVDIEAVGIDPTGRRHRQGGNSVLARIGCATRRLAFAAGSKHTFGWDGDPNFQACPRVFDIARGALPILRDDSITPRGDFGGATCIADDQLGTQFSDAALPSAGRGLFYLTRAGGPLPGTWDSSGDPALVGSRDDSLQSCP